MTDDDLAALCIWTEAQAEPYEGQVAVGRVIRNRTALHYQSDGTIGGTVLHPYAFSAFMFDWVNGEYVEVASGHMAMELRAIDLLTKAEKTNAWAECVKAWADSQTGSGFVGGPQFQKLGSETVLYVNPEVEHPDWATPDKFVCQIYHHSFYHG